MDRDAAARTSIRRSSRLSSAVLEQVPPAVAELEVLGAPVQFHVLAGKSHDDVVVDFDTEADRVTPLLVPFVRSVQR